jgi:hypothetical protein
LASRDLCFRVRSGECDLVAGIVAEFKRGGPDLEAFHALDETSPIGPAAEFAISHHPQPDLLLQGHNIADAAVLQGQEGIITHFSNSVLPECLPQNWWPQQTTDMVSAEWRAARNAREHCFPKLLCLATIT